MILAAKILFVLTIITYIVLMLFFRFRPWSEKTIVISILFNILAQMYLLSKGINSYTMAFLVVEASEAFMAGNAIERMQKFMNIRQKESKIFHEDIRQGDDSNSTDNDEAQPRMTPFTTYITIRIDGQYDSEIIDVDAAVESAVEQIISGAQSNAEYDGMNGGVEITDIVNCGETI